MAIPRGDSIGARYYGSALGRFLTPDWSAAPEAVPYANPGDPQSLNLYGYVLNNTVTGTDAGGHWCQQAAFYHAPANLAYKSGMPPATGKLENLLECTAACTGLRCATSCGAQFGRRRMSPVLSPR